MADIVETGEFPPAITEIAINEPVIGGPGGVSNRAPSQLANRTRWLKDQIDAILASLGTLYALRDGHYSTLRAGATTKGDVGLGAVANYPPTDSATEGATDKLATGAAAKAAYDRGTQALNAANTKAAQTGTYGIRATATTKADVGLGSVPNYPATASVADASNSKFATAGAVRSAYNKGVEALNLANTKAATTGTYGIRATGTTKGDVGLGNVPNYPATSSVSDASNSKLATAGAVAAAYALAASRLEDVRLGSETYVGFASGATADVDHRAGAGYVTSGIRIRREGDGTHEVKGMFRKQVQRRFNGGAFITVNQA